MAKKMNTVEQQMRELTEKIIQDMGYSLVGVLYKKGELTLTIDKDGGVGVEDCAAVSRALDSLIEESHILRESYQLIVSSPGIS
ncbi:MAG: hypothetical protein Q8P39_02505 [Candidatus Yanofskybacteria bacterium]|nr:hypothetical protein [Candidatus Yanofskybacteria bacterium]